MDAVAYSGPNVSVSEDRGLRQEQAVKLVGIKATVLLR